MDSREALEKRVTDLERQVSALRAGGRVLGIRKRAGRAAQSTR
jgi:phage shock protein A